MREQISMTNVPEFPHDAYHADRGLNPARREKKRPVKLAVIERTPPTINNLGHAHPARRGQMGRSFEPFSHPTPALLALNMPRTYRQAHS